MKKRIFALAVVTMLFATTAFAAASDHAGNGNSWDQMYQYCNQMMQSWGGKAPDQNGKTQPQGQPMSYNGGMMMGNGNNGYMGMSGNGNMMGNDSYGSIMGTGNNGNGNMMSIVEFQ